MALFLFVLVKAALAFFVNCSLRPFSLFWQAQYVYVFPLKPLPFCKFFVDLGSTTKSAASLFLLSLCLATLSSSPSFLYFNLSGRHCFLFSSVLSGYNGSPNISYSRGTTRLMSWRHGELCLCSLQFLVVSPLLYPLWSFLGLEMYCVI